MKALFRLALVAVAAAAAVAFVEGIRTLALGNRPHTSILHHAYSRITTITDPDGPAAPFSPPAALSGDADADLHPFLADRHEFEALLPLFKGINAGIGNTDFYDLMTENAAINIDDGDCTRMKPNIRKSTVQLRSRLFNVYDPPVVFYDADAALPEPAARFLGHYGIRTATLTTNRYGERFTVPTIARREKVLVAGDSVALGVGVDDTETLASRLQGRDIARQYVNLGISGVGARQIACALDAAAERYPEQIVEVIYVFCDNDYNPSDPRADPAAIVTWLKTFAERNGVRRVNILRAPYVQAIFPIAVDSDTDRMRADSARQLSRLSSDAGFRYLDIADLGLREIGSSSSVFGVFRMFVDKIHLSPYGTGMVAQALQE